MVWLDVKNYLFAGREISQSISQNIPREHSYTQREKRVKTKGDTFNFGHKVLYIMDTLQDEYSIRGFDLIMDLRLVVKNSAVAEAGERGSEECVRIKGSCGLRWLFILGMVTGVANAVPGNPRCNRGLVGHREV